MGFLDTILFPFEWFNSTIMVGVETGLTALGMSNESGWTWTLSIVGLVVVLRILLIPLFVRQIHSMRRMQMIQPEIMKIQKKYKGKKDEASRRAMTEETMALYRQGGANPFSSCMPILLQSPFFFALFRMLNAIPDIARGDREPIGFFTQDLAQKMEGSSIFGAMLSESFTRAEDLSTRILTVVLIIAMSATTFITQRQLMRKNMPATALDNPMARQQKVLMYLLPVIFAVTGVHFPIGVLLYWTTTNLWTMGQQFYVIRRMPAPGSPAEKALRERRAAKGQTVKEVQLKSAELNESLRAKQGGGGSAEGTEDAPRTGQRVQPKRKNRNRSGNRPKGR